MLKDKQKDFRNSGHCGRANCGICRPDKKWKRNKADRAALRVFLRRLTGREDI